MRNMVHTTKIINSWSSLNLRQYMAPCTHKSSTYNGHFVVRLWALAIVSMTCFNLNCKELHLLKVFFFPATTVLLTERRFHELHFVCYPLQGNPKTWRLPQQHLISINHFIFGVLNIRHKEIHRNKYNSLLFKTRSINKDSSKIGFLEVQIHSCPTACTYCKDVSMLFLFGISTLPICAHWMTRLLNTKPHYLTKPITLQMKLKVPPLKNNNLWSQCGPTFWWV